MLSINGFIRECYENAKAHGWHDKSRTLGESLALIHSEWSEALEEFRSDKPAVYCFNGECGRIAEFPDGENCATCIDCLLAGDSMSEKPEGRFIELVDGIIRIFDFMGEMNIESKADTVDAVIQEWFVMTAWEFGENIMGYEFNNFPDVIAELHRLTAKRHLMSAVALAMNYIKQNGGDVEALLRAKHEYNKTRSYRHGGKKA